MLEQPLDAISLEDIKALVVYARCEGPTLDFKEAFPAADHKGVRDFLADVTAFTHRSRDGKRVLLVSQSPTRRCRSGMEHRGHQQSR